MLVYNDKKIVKSTNEYIQHLLSLIRNVSKNISLEALTEILIECGELETGIADDVCEQVDRQTAVLKITRGVSTLCGRALFRVWEGYSVPPLLMSLRQQIENLRSYRLPDYVQVGIPEGYAYYGLYPEMYIEAAKKFYGDRSPYECVCVGLRSIGTSLSGVVSGTLMELGCSVTSYTLRPRGHPYNRSIRVDTKLEQYFKQHIDSYFCIIDEGPGMSGSSFIGTSDFYSQLGIQDDKIVLFPSWVPEGSEFVSEHAGNAWKRYQKYSLSFEEVWFSNGNMEKLIGKGTFRNVSAGKWRDIFYSDSVSFPAVHPYHERLKYLWYADSDNGNTMNKNDPIMVKFVGLGKYGIEAYERSKKIARAGFSPLSLGFKHGFMLMPFIEGGPMKISDITPAFLKYVSKYLAYINDELPGRKGMSSIEIIEMVRVNINEGLGPQWLEKIERFGEQFADVYEENMVAIDGRMLPHEWLHTPGGWVKMDQTEHYFNQFYPGCQNIAWDIAGFCIEFRLSPRSQAILVNEYMRLSGDDFLNERLYLFRIAYLACRLGYVVMAQQVLKSSSEGQRFSALAEYYRNQLKMDIMENYEWKGTFYGQCNEYD